MSAARQPTPPPDMGGLDELTRLTKMRANERLKDQQREADAQPQESEPVRRKAPAGRTRGGHRPPPAAADAIPTTVRFDPEESAEVDQFVLELRVEAQRRNLDKSEVVREVLRLAREHEPTRRALLKRLR
ncbi:hypothetical protein ACFQ6U_35885 [Streptomyces sp. NPDC056465]|uniref:hypothetical protein n=1 Tax=Streptomyces sp. NPDC056465 TaxID=3345829 RepID=UPI0036939824